MKIPGAERAGCFVRKQRDAAVEGAKKATHTAADMSGRGLDAAVAGSRKGLAGLGDLSSRAGSAAVEGSMAGATAIADAAVKGAAAAASGAQTAASGVVDATAKGAATAMSGGQYAARGIVDASARGLSVASEGGRRAMEFGRKSAADLLSASQGVLASELGRRPECHAREDLGRTGDDLRQGDGRRVPRHVHRWRKSSDVRRRPHAGRRFRGRARSVG